MEEQVGVGCIVLRDHHDRPVLLLRRAFGRFEGQWCFVAGTVESGEAPCVATKRELIEETGLQARHVEPVSVHTEPGLLLHVFLARVSDDSALITNREHTEAGWFSFEEAAQLLPRRAQRKVLEAIRSA